MIGLRFLVNDGFCLGSDGRMDMEARFLLSLGSEFSELLDERLVLLECQILFAEKDNATSRHDDAELSNQFIGIRSIEKIFQLEIGILTADAGSDLEIVVMIKTASWLERLDFQLWKGYGGHSEIVTLALLVEKFAYKYEVAAFSAVGKLSGIEAIAMDEIVDLRSDLRHDEMCTDNRSRVLQDQVALLGIDQAEIITSPHRLTRPHRLLRP